MMSMADLLEVAAPQAAFLCKPVQAASLSILRSGRSKPVLGLVAVLLLAVAAGCAAGGQGPEPQAPPEGTNLKLQHPSGPAGPPLTITLQDALQRAERNSPEFQAAVTAAKAASRGRVQARAAMLPSLSYTMQYLNTQGNGISPVGRYVTNDGVHVYRAWAVIHEDMPGSFFINAGPRAAAYQEALARANQEIARRGLDVTVTHDYYALIVAQRSYATAQSGLQSAQHFLQVSKELEQGGEVAHSDVIRFQLAYNKQLQALQDAEAAMSDARLNLAVLLFPQLNENFTPVDDLETAPALPPFGDVASLAKEHNPDLRAAMAAYRQARLNVSVARAAFLPSLGLDLDYGVEANALALYSAVNLTRPGVRQPNLGYFATYSVNLPVWDWGARLSRLHQAKDQAQLERLNLSFAQKKQLSNLYSYYNEALTAWHQLDTLRDSAQLAAHNLQLVTMQYKAGEATVLEVLDAETSLNAARDAYAAGELRYRTGLSTLQTLTGSF
jgi:outer membrane protein